MKKNRLSSRLSAARPVAAVPAAAGHRPLLLAMALAAGFSALPARAQPAGATAIHGTAHLQQQGSRLVVTTTNGAGTAHSAINWQSFSVPGGTTTHFAQPHAGSTSINRVLGPDPSAIFGTLSSNGRLVLVNPAGITVGAGAVVDTAGFTASTLRMTDADALAGRLRFGDGTPGGPLRVDGKVLARQGDVVLIAPQVETGAQALVESPQGATILAAGQKVEVTGRGLEGIVFEVQAPGDQAVNLGTLSGDAVGIFAGTLRHSGLVQAQAVSAEGGKVVLKAAGDALVDGDIASRAGSKGGSIDVFGQRVGLLAGATLDASGELGGGQVRVGGDYQGQNAAVPNAARTYVDAAASIQADATVNGDGGRVIVWSDEVTRMHGQISARGGSQGGDGGFSEVSGKQYLDFTGLVDLRAPQGNTGTLLLDPEDITIVRSDSTSSSNTFPSTDPSYPGSVFEPSSAGPVTLTDSHLILQLGSSHVVVKTSTPLSTNNAGQITLMSDAVVAWTSGNDLSLLADKGITLAGTINAGVGGGLHLKSLGGDITQPDTGLIAADRVVVESSAAVSLLGGNRIGQLAGSASAEFFVKNAQTLGVGNVVTAYAGASGITAGSVRLETTAPGAHIHAEAPVTAESGEIVLDAGGSITGYGVFTTNGGSAGHVRLQSRGGDVQFADIDTTGAASGAQAGNVDVIAAGSIKGSPGEGGEYFWIHAEGAAGESTGDSGQAGGKGGNVTLRFGGSLGPGSIYADGGTGGSGENTTLGHGGQGGQGGSVTIERTGGDLVLAGTDISAVGGGGGTAASSAGLGGNGGNGGNVALKAPGKVVLDAPYINALGGWGGWTPSSGTSGAEGALGSFSVASSSVEVPVDSWFDVNANWTHSGVLDILGNASLGVEGKFHNLGQVNLHDGAWLDVYSGSFHNAGLLKAVSGASYAVLTQNTGTVEVAAGAALTLPGFSANAGVIRVDGTLELAPNYDPCMLKLCEVPTLSAAATTAGAFTNEATGTLTGNGVISVDGGTGTIDNFGKIAPGTAGSVGTLGIEGNLAMQSGSVLALDVKDPLSHDVLNVSGAARTDGTVEVSYAPGATFAAGDSISVLRTGTLDAAVLPGVTAPEMAAAASGNELLLRAVSPVPAPSPAPAPAAKQSEQLENQLLAFARLLAELQRQHDERPMGKDDIVVTDAACKPS